MFKEGEINNPNGRPLGSRNRINSRIISALEKLIYEIERAGIKNVVDKAKADTLVNALVKLAPKDLNINIGGQTENPIVLELRKLRESYDIEQKTEGSPKNTPERMECAGRKDGNGEKLDSKP